MLLYFRSIYVIFASHYFDHVHALDASE